jgi:hypothetical protein
VNGTKCCYTLCRGSSNGVDLSHGAISITASWCNVASAMTNQDTVTCGAAQPCALLGFNVLPTVCETYGYPEFVSSYVVLPFRLVKQTSGRTWRSISQSSSHLRV